MSILKSKTAAIGWTIEPCFIITLHVKDLELLKAIHGFFKVGSISIVNGKFAQYRVRNRQELPVIIDHFNKYPLHTSKMINFAYFCEILDLMGSKIHTKVNGFLKLISLINKLLRGFRAQKWIIIFLLLLCLSNIWPNLFEGLCLSITPVVSYLNADLHKDKIILENRKKSGVYRW